MATRYAFSIDLDRCIGCQACAVACSAGNDLPDGVAYVGVGELVRRRDGGLWGSFDHHRCFHCGAAPCVLVCPTGALSKRDGLTAVDRAACSGCGYCSDACPFEVPSVRSGHVEKCVGCLDHARDGRAPWCEQTCPSQAIRFGEREPLLGEARARADGLRGRHPDACVYGETQLGGLGLLLVLLDRPEVYGLPANPVTPVALRAWQTLQPVATGLSAGAALAMGVMFVVARRRRVEEEEGAHGRSDASSARPASEDAKASEP